MPPVEYYLRRADELAQNVVNAWAINVKADNAALLTGDFESVMDRACEYRIAKSAGVGEQAARQAFAEAYKSFEEKRANRAAG